MRPKVNEIHSRLYLKIRVSSRDLIRLFMVLIILASFGVTSGLCQDFNKVYGNWEIENIILVSPPGKIEFKKVRQQCIHQKIVITRLQFKFSSSNCFLLRTIRDFKITKHFILSSDDVISENKYADKTLFYLFEYRKERSIEGFKTNYTFESNEGEVPELEIFVINKNHLLLVQDENLIYLARKN